MMGWRFSILASSLCFAAGCGGLGKTGDLFNINPLKPSDKALARGDRDTSRRSSLVASLTNKKATPATPDSMAWAKYYEGQAAHAGIDSAKQADLRLKAREAFQTALNAEPNNLDALLGLGNVLSAQGEHDQALSVFSKVLKKHPKDAAVHCAIASCHARRDAWTEAAASLVAATELEPGRRDYQEMLGVALVRARRIDDGYAILSKAVGAPQAHYRVAQALHQTKQDDKCAHHLYLALAANPKLTAASELLKQVKHLPKSDTDFGQFVATIDFQDSPLSPGEIRPVSASDVQRPEQDRIIFHHGAAERIRRSWDTGNGWCIVTGLQNMEVLPGGGATQHVKYRMANSANFNGSTNEPRVELYFGPESNWIVVHVNDNLSMPTLSGPAGQVLDQASRAVHDLEALRYQVLAQIADDGTNFQKRTELRQTFLPIVERQIITLRNLLDKNSHVSR